MATILLQEDFPGVTWARRNCDGVGFLDIVENDGALDVTGGNLVVSNQTTAAWGDLGVCFGGSFTRAAGLAFVARATIGGGADVRWGSSQNPATATLLPANANPDETNSFYFDDGDLKYADSNIGGPSMGTVPTGTYSIAQVHRTAGDFMLIKGEAYTDWTLLWIGNAWTNDPIYHAAWTLEASTWHTMRAVNLPAPWDTDYGIATDRKASTPAAGTTFVHEADFILEWTQTTVPSADTTDVLIRVQDATNYWIVRVNSSGDLSLQEVVGGSPTQRANSAGTIANGERIVVNAVGNTITAWGNNVQLWTYASASNFATKTAGEVDALGTAGVVTNLVTYPRTLSGDANTVLNRAFD